MASQADFKASIDEVSEASVVNTPNSSGPNNVLFTSGLIASFNFPFVSICFEDTPWVTK